MPRSLTLPTVNSGHAFASALSNAWTFHATGNSSGGADDIPGSNDATLSGAILSDTVGLDCDPETDRATISPINLLPSANAFSIMWRSKLDADNTESMICGRTSDADYFVWSNNSGAVQLRANGVDFSWPGGSGTTTPTDYCITGNGSANWTMRLFTKAASGTNWTEIGSSKVSSAVNFYIDSLGAGFNANSLWLQGELEYFLIFNTALTESNLDTNFSDPYSIFSAGSTPLSSGAASTTSSGNTIATVVCTAASGGTSPYTYQWHRSTTTGFTPGGGNIVSGATSLTLNDTGLTNGTVYYYKCVATDSAAATVTSNQTTATPTVLASGTASLVSVGNTVATVTCGVATGGTSPYAYQWYRSTSSGFTPGGGNIISGATALTRNDTGLTNGTTYFYKCVATDSASATVISNQVSATPTDTIVLICEGDSLTAGTGSTSGQTYPVQLDAIVGSQFSTTNVGTGGARIADLVGRQATIDAYYNASAVANYLLVWAGTNDLFDGTSGATALAALSSYCSARQTTGWKVYVVTALPRTNSGTPGGFEAQRLIYNEGIRTTFLDFADVLIDIANEQYLSNSTNTTYFGDLVHLTNAGYQIVAFRAKVAINGSDGGTVTSGGSYTAASNVRSGTDRGDGTIGTLAVPTASQVLTGVSVDATTGNVVLPNVGDVQSGVTFGPSSGSTGTFVVPTEAQVESGVDFGAGGTEFTGTLTGSGSGDWTADEKAAIRTILGIPASGTTPEAPSAGALKVIDDLLDTEVAALTTAVADLPTNAELATALASADDATLSAIAAEAVKTAAIKVKTDNLPSDPADASDIAAAFSSLASTLSTITGLIDTEVAAIKAKTDGLPADTAASLTAIQGYVDTLETEVAKVIKSGESRTYARSGEASITFTETRV